MEATCKICGSAGKFLCVTPNEHSATALLNHFRCVNCGTVFVGDRLDADELAAAYSTLDSATYYSETQVTGDRKMLAAIDDLQGPLPDKNAAILDLGTGNGRFLELLDRAGYRNLAGQELPEVRQPWASERGITVYRDHDYSTIPDSRFDCVTLLDVAEHILDPHHLFASCNRMLRDGGILYIHTPVVTIIDRVMHGLQRTRACRKLGTVWQRGRTSVFHLQNYTRASLGMLLETHGFTCCSLRMTNELSWPVSRYVRVYLCEKQRLPLWLAPIATPFFWPFLATPLFNSNKAIALARKSRAALTESSLTDVPVIDRETANCIA